MKAYRNLKFLGGEKCVKKAMRARITSPVHVARSTSRTGENEWRVRHWQNLDRNLNVCMIAENLRMDKIVVHKIIIEKLGMRKICVKVVSKVLTGQKE